MPTWNTCSVCSKLIHEVDTTHVDGKAYCDKHIPSEEKAVGLCVAKSCPKKAIHIFREQGYCDEHYEAALKFERPGVPEKTRKPEVVSIRPRVVTAEVAAAEDLCMDAVRKTLESAFMSDSAKNDLWRDIVLAWMRRGLLTDRAAQLMIQKKFE